jgi:broad-specificity NMP kinase
MKMVNLYGGPGCGKSTLAAHIFSVLKRNNVSTELVGEFAKELIYLGNEIQLVNQVYIMGCQYRKQKDLERNNIEIAISDSPLNLQLVYCQNKPYFKEQTALVHKLNSEFNNIDIFVNRVKPYQTYGRVHDEIQAKHIDMLVREAMHNTFDYEVDGDTDGADEIAEEILRIARS